MGFPDICFAIEDFDVAFKGLVSILPRPVLHGPAWRMLSLLQACLS